MNDALASSPGGGPHADDVSVVVIGRNEGRRLHRCFASITALSANSIPRELIYVDSGSIDDSLQTASHYGAKIVALHSTQPTAALGRNAGWRAASGRIILFLDGDTVLAPGFLTAALACFAAEAVAVVWGHRRELHPEASIYNRVSDLDWMYPAGPAPFCGGDALVRRSVLEQTGGFDDTLIAGEEPELCRRILALGHTILHIDEPMTGHDLEITSLSQYWRRATRAGHAYAEVSARFANTADPFWSADARRNRRHAVALLALPLLALWLTAFLRSAVPVFAFIAVAALLVARTAWKARWKSGRPFTLLLYGAHSHLQQIPIFIGQMGFQFRRRRGNRRILVEYK